MKRYGFKGERSTSYHTQKPMQTCFETGKAVRGGGAEPLENLPQGPMKPAIVSLCARAGSVERDKFTAARPPRHEINLITEERSAVATVLDSSYQEKT